MPKNGDQGIGLNGSVKNPIVAVFIHISVSDFGAATHPGVGGGTHRRRATFDRCEVRGVFLRVVVVVLICSCVCVRPVSLYTSS